LGRSGDQPRSKVIFLKTEDREGQRIMVRFIKAILFLFLTSTAFISVSGQEKEKRFGDLTITEDLIRREILSLGGDWESGKKPSLVSFYGGKFEIITLRCYHTCRL
jgi:hypothetical protein